MSPTRVRRLKKGTVVVVALAAAVGLRYMGRLGAQAPAAQSYQTVAFPRVEAYSFNGDVRNLPQRAPSGRPPKPEFERPETDRKGQADPLSNIPNNVFRAPMPSPIISFAGMKFSDACTGGQCGAGWPPDINGDVGPTHYIEAVNDAYGIYLKSTGAKLASFTENSLWSGTGQPQCDGHAFGDPIVVYDPLSDRWILTHFAFSTDGSGNPIVPFYQCFAASKTSDPVSGGWWLYALRLDGVAPVPAGTLNDYPKFGIWNDGCLYMAANGFVAPSFNYNGSIFASFNKATMYSGAGLGGAIGFLPYPANDVFTMVPSNLSGPRGMLPPAGTPNYFVSESINVFAFLVRKFTPGASCGGGGTLGAPTSVSQATYAVFGGSNVPQPGTANTLDWIDDRIMQKVQYRRIGSTESLWVVHPVEPTNTSTTVRPQWAELNVTGGTVSATPAQQQIYAPDTTIWRWMPSIAADKNGNAAVGYSTSNGTVPNYPSIAYSGRLATDPANTLPQTEVQLHAGTGSQTTFNRWGDYTAMSVDPDGCTFWYTNEHMVSTGTDWNTRIGSFKFPTCIVRRPPADLDGDFRSDRTVRRPSNNTFYSALVSGAAKATVWGLAGDKDVTGDFDGDGKADIAVWRPSDGTWYVIWSSNGTIHATVWGANGDIPVPGDVDGDGKTDFVIFRPSNGGWYSLKSAGGASFLGWGSSTDWPLLADYDGDGKVDYTVFRPSNGFWYSFMSGGGVLFIGWGTAGDIPVVGNWDSDTLADVAVWRPSTGQWFINKSTGGSIVTSWGGATDIPVSADQDGDGLSDFTVWRSTDGNWLTLFNQGGVAVVQWGQAGDEPTGRRPGS